MQVTHDQREQGGRFILNDDRAPTSIASGRSTRPLLPPEPGYGEAGRRMMPSPTSRTRTGGFVKWPPPPTDAMCPRSRRPSPGLRGSPAPPVAAIGTGADRGRPLGQGAGPAMVALARGRAHDRVHQHYALRRLVAGQRLLFRTQDVLSILDLAGSGGLPLAAPGRSKR
jgi:hypothetical protein